jgi:hypothetical protein
VRRAKFFRSFKSLERTDTVGRAVPLLHFRPHGQHRWLGTLPETRFASTANTLFDHVFDTCTATQRGVYVGLGLLRGFWVHACLIPTHTAPDDTVAAVDVSTVSVPPLENLGTACTIGAGCIGGIGSLLAFPPRSSILTSGGLHPVVPSSLARNL